MLSAKVPVMLTYWFSDMSFALSFLLLLLIAIIAIIRVVGIIVMIDNFIVIGIIIRNNFSKAGFV